MGSTMSSCKVRHSTKIFISPVFGQTITHVVPNFCWVSYLKASLKPIFLSWYLEQDKTSKLRKRCVHESGSKQTDEPGTDCWRHSKQHGSISQPTVDPVPVCYNIETKSKLRLWDLSDMSIKFSKRTNAWDDIHISNNVNTGCSIRVETLGNFEGKSRLPRQNRGILVKIPR